MPIPITIIDAFAHKPFTGNPAAVCVLEEEMPDDWMQSIAAEMNLSETAFLLREGDRWRLRWMTPAVEVDLCGHATLAGAKYLLTEGIADPSQPILFETRSGTLSATESGEQITLDLPAIQTRPIDYLDILAEALVRVERAGHRTVLHVHDEIVCEIGSAAELVEVTSLCEVTPPWAQGLPMQVQGYAASRYRK